MTLLDTAEVLATCIYPIKACGALQVPALRIDRWGGAEDDRRWAIVNTQDEVTWQGEHPRLVLITPQLDGRTLRLHAPGHEVMEVDDTRLAPRAIRLWNDQAQRHENFTALQAGDAVNDWVSGVAGASLQLVKLPDAAVGRPDARRLHLVSEASCHEADAQLQHLGHPAAHWLRYRPNIVLGGVALPLQAFAEDFLESLSWPQPGGEARLEVRSRCVRCIVPNVDPENAAVSDAPLAALAGLSGERFPGEPVCFGVYGQAQPETVLSRGQSVQLHYSF